MPRETSELTGSMLWPYYQMFFTHAFNSKDEYMKEFKDPNYPLHTVDGKKCPIYFVYGGKKAIMFHSDRWLEMMDSNKEHGCKWKEMDC